jgi:hypothetical protein
MTSTGGSKRGEMDTDHAWALPEKDSEEDEQPVLLLLLAPAALKPLSSITDMALELRKNAEHHTSVGTERERLDDGRCAGGDRSGTQGGVRAPPLDGMAVRERADGMGECKRLIML